METLMETLHRIEAEEEQKRGKKWRAMDRRERNLAILRRWRKEKKARAKAGRRCDDVRRLIGFAGAVALIGATIITTQIAPESRMEVAKEGSAERVQEAYVVQALSSEVAITRPWHVIEGVTVYHYCACTQCCGKTVDNPAYGITRSGTVATAGRTIAVDPDIIPLGSEVVVNGNTYIAEDTGGGIKGYTVDIYCDSHAEAIEQGTYQTALKWRNEHKSQNYAG